MLDEISKHLDKKINIVAKYNEDDRILYPNLNFLGYRTQQQIYNEIFPITNLLILTSNNEGLPFACLEALSHGIPIAIRDTYMTAKWLVNNGNNGFLFNKNEMPMQIADKLRKYNINQFDRDKIINFVETNFSESNFVKL